MAWDDEYEYQPSGWTTFSDPNILAKIGEKPPADTIPLDVSIQNREVVNPPGGTLYDMWSTAGDVGKLIGGGLERAAAGALNVFRPLGSEPYRAQIPIPERAVAAVDAFSNVSGLPSPLTPAMKAGNALATLGRGLEDLAPSALAAAGGGILVGRKGSGVDLDALKRAEYLESMNKYNAISKPVSPEEVIKQEEAIRKETGWGRLPGDREWRTERPDIGSETLDVPNFLKAKVEYEQSGISNVYPPLSILMPQHKELYKAYPGAADIGVRVQGAPGTGSYSPFFDQITVSPSFLPTPGVPMSAKQQDSLWSALLHEVTHAIQSREQFARGGTPSEFHPKNYEGLAKDFDALEKEVTNLGMKQGFGKSLITKIMNETIAGKVDPLADYGNIPGLSGALEKYKQQHGELQSIRDAAYSQYERLAGEAEARLVQNRRSLSEADRRRYSPFTDNFYGLPVKPDQLIVRNQTSPFIYPLIANRDTLLGDLKRPIRTMPPPRDAFLSMR